MLAFRPNNCARMVVMLVTCVCLIATSVAWAENKRVNCRKYVYAPVCRGSVKRNYFALPIKMNRLDSTLLDIPKQITFDAKLTSPTNYHAARLNFDDQDIKIVKAVYKWIVQNRLMAIKSGQNSYNDE